MKLLHSLFVAAAALAVSTASAGAEPYKIRVGHGAAVEEQLWLMKALPSVTPNQGKSYTLDYQLFRGTDQRFKAVEAGELDVFTASGATAVIAFSQGLRFKAVASISMESAIELARCLRDLPTVPDAFAAYERLRRTRVERIIAADNLPNVHS